MIGIEIVRRLTTLLNGLRIAFFTTAINSPRLGEVNRG